MKVGTVDLTLDLTLDPLLDPLRFLNTVKYNVTPIIITTPVIMAATIDFFIYNKIRFLLYT